jgi:putative transposase
MGRKRRIHIPGGICHITQQCHWKSFAFADENIKQKYLDLGYEIATHEQVEIIDFSLQDSHPHWVLKAPDREEYTMSQFMHKLNTRFGKWFNRTFHRKGTFWAGRFSCTWVEPGSMHLFEVTRYVDRNPLERQNNPIRPQDYRWGSFHYLFQPESPYSVTFLRYLYQAHPEKSEAEAWQWYQALVEEADLDGEKRQRFFRQVRALPLLGSEWFRQKGKAIYQSSVKNLQLRGLSWIKMVRDYSQLFRPLAQPSLS